MSEDRKSPRFLRFLGQVGTRLKKRLYFSIIVSYNASLIICLLCNFHDQLAKALIIYKIIKNLRRVGSLHFKEVIIQTRDTAAAVWKFLLGETYYHV